MAPTVRSIRPERTEVAEVCIHCSGCRYILDEVETTFGEFEAVSYLCFMCLGTGRKMGKAERDTIKAAR